MAEAAERLLYTPPDWLVNQASSANAINTATRAAEADRRHYVGQVLVSYSAPVTTAHTIELRSGSNVFLTLQVGPATYTQPIGWVFARLLRANVNEALNVVVGAAGASVVSQVNIVGWSNRA